MSTEYTHQLLKIVVAQICQTIGYHSIQSTPLELLGDLLHKYLQELTRHTHRYTELYGRTEANLDDLGLAFRDLNVQLPDFEEYINYVEPVCFPYDVPKYPIHKDSNLNFLKPGSKEVLTRPVHIHEHLPPIFPEKESEATEIGNNDGENSETNSNCNTYENGLFKRPEINSDGPLFKKPRFAFEEEGRPTREITSVMMTSSGFISPAREGKLPDTKPPQLPQIRSKSPSPLPNILPSTTPLPVGNVENKFDKKTKKKLNSYTLINSEYKDKEHKKRNKLALLASVAVAEKDGKSIKSIKSIKSLQNKSNAKLANNHYHGHHLSEKQKLLMNKKQKNKLKKHKDKQRALHALSNDVPETINSNILCERGNIEMDNAMSSSSKMMKSDLNLKTLDHHRSSDTIIIDIDSKHKIDKLSSEPDKQKLNIFKKISSASKKDRDDLSKSPSLYPDSQILSSIPEGTTITPAPPIVKSYKNHTIALDSEMSITKIPSNIMSQSFSREDGVKGEINKLSTPTKIKQRKPRKNKLIANQQPLDETMPLNLSHTNSINIKNELKDSNKISKIKKERKNKIKQKESKKDQKGHGKQHLKKFNMMTDYSNLKNSINPLQSIFPPNINNTNAEGHPYGVPPYGPPNFPTVPTIPMFPFYPFPPRPGLIPSTSLFSPFPQLPDNTHLKNCLSPMMRFDFNNVNKNSSLLKYDESHALPPLPPGEIEKGYCNVAPLVPESMKLQLPPTQFTPSTIELNRKSLQRESDIKEVKVEKRGRGRPPLSSYQHHNTYKTAVVAAAITTNVHHVMEHQQQLVHSNINSGLQYKKSPKVTNETPIEISDDEKPKSDIDEKTNINKTCLDNNLILSSKDHNPPQSEHDGYVNNNNSMNDRLKEHDQIIDSIIEDDIESSSMHEINGNKKHEKRKDKEHKKGKKGKDKDGKIKKKKDKKDKLKNKEKDKSGKRKDREGKKEKEKLKKLKKEKKKEKMRAIYSSDEEKQLNDSSGDCGSVPKLTLKIGATNSPQHSIEERKLQKNDRRESSPELARISPLVTRPPKQKNLNEYQNQIHPDDTYGGVTTSSSNQFLQSSSSPSKLYSSSSTTDKHNHHYYNHHHRYNSKTTLNSSFSMQEQHQNLNYNNYNDKVFNVHSSNYVSSSVPSSSATSINSQSHINSGYSRYGVNDGEGGGIINDDDNNSFGDSLSTRIKVATSLLERNYNSNTNYCTGSANSTNMPLSSNSNNNVYNSNSSNNYNLNSTSSSYRHESSSSISNTWSSSSSSKVNNNLTSINDLNNRPAYYIDTDGNQVWICPACGRVDDGTPMIGCDGCDAWYHWVCVGIQVPPDDNEDWYCRVCISKKQEAHGSDKKRKRKKKNKGN